MRIISLFLFESKKELLWVGSKSTYRRCLARLMTMSPWYPIGKPTVNYNYIQIQSAVSKCFEIKQRYKSKSTGKQKIHHQQSSVLLHGVFTCVFSLRAIRFSRYLDLGYSPTTSD